MANTRKAAYEARTVNPSRTGEKALPAEVRGTGGRGQTRIMAVP